MNEHEFYAQMRRVYDRLDKADRAIRDAKNGMIISMIIAIGALLFSTALVFRIFWFPA